MRNYDHVLNGRTEENMLSFVMHYKYISFSKDTF